ncbi:MAG: DUF1194 domain-containing protein [Pikeienuella sp.]
MKSIAAILFGFGLLAQKAQANCEIALALALDISSSVNSAEYDVQKGGLARALRDPVVRAALLDPPGGVTLMVYEWSGWQQQDVINDWALIRSDADIDAFAASLEAHQRQYAEFSTAIGRALLYGAQMFERLPHPCDRHIIDVSGDGVSNEAIAPDAPSVVNHMRGITVNALVIDGATPSPVSYYRDKVISGPGAFMMVARNGFDDYPELIKGKLARELQHVLYLGEAQRTQVSQ